MPKRTLKLFGLLAGAFMLLALTAATAFGAQLSPYQQTTPPAKTPLTQEELEQFWQAQYPSLMGIESTGAGSVYSHELLAKAQPDECYAGIGITPTATLPDCSPPDEQPKVNQAYVWGMTDYANTIWFGTAPNVHCLVIGGFLGASSPLETDSYTCEFGEGPYAPPLPDFIGDWRPPKLYIYDNDDQQLTDITPHTLLGTLFLSNTLGIRSATTYGDYVIFAGPAFAPTGSINMFLFNAATRTFVRARNLPDYSNIRKWIQVDGVLYAAVGTEFGGAVLRYVGDPTSANPATQFAFVEVGELDADGAEIALHEGRLFVNTWPNDLCGCAIAGLWMSPLIESDGLTTTELLAWTKVFTYDQYEPDPVSAATYGGGAMLSYQGDLYFGTMHVPFLNTIAHIGAYALSDPVDISEAIVGSQRSIAIFRGRNFDDPVPQVELLYGEEELPTFDPFVFGWFISPTLMGPPLYGPSGFGNMFNNYTWSMAEYDGQLFVGTMDWSYLLDDLLQTIQNLPGIPTLPAITLADATPGADLFRFFSATDPAIAEDKTGVGNYSSYGIRNLLSRAEGLYLGMANPMNLLTDLTDDKPEGGWELLRLKRDLIPITVTLEGNGSVSSDLDIDCGIICSASYDRGTTIVMTATPAADSLFSGWDGACHGTGGCSVTLTADQTVTATFVKKQFPLTVHLPGNGSGLVTSLPGGISCSVLICSANFEIGTDVTLHAAAFLGSEFLEWDGPCSGTADCPLTINASTEVTATFSKLVYNLEVERDGGGKVVSAPGAIDCGATCTDSYFYGATVSLTPTPDADSVLAAWGGACSGAGACNVTLTGNTLVTATFAKKQFPLTVHIGGAGSGQVTSLPAGVDCSQPSCATNFDIGTVLSLSALNFPGAVFDGWGGACSGSGACQVTMNSAKDVTANFSLSAEQFPLTVHFSGDGGGQVTSVPAGIGCSENPCSANFVVGTAVDLSALNIPGSAFDGWSGACSGTGECHITMNGAREVTATFGLSAEQFPLTVHFSGDGGGQVISLPAGIGCSEEPCSADFVIGTAVSLSALNSPGAVFEGWSGPCSGTGECHITMNGAREVTATFGLSAEQFPLTVHFSGDGSGQVISLPAGIGCSGSPCSANFAIGTAVDLSALNIAGSVFDGWSGDCSGAGACQVTMNQAREVTATFSLSAQQFPLTIHVIGSGSGQVTSVPAGISCSASSCSVDFAIGTAVDLSALGFTGSSFDGWSGDCSSSGACQVTLNGAREVTATFNLSGVGNILVEGAFTAGSVLTYTGQLSMNSLDQCSWDFGDGATEGCDGALGVSGVDALLDITVQTTHVYSETGTYVVTLTASNDAGTVVATQQVIILAEGPTAEAPNAQPGMPEKLFVPFVNHE